MKTEEHRACEQSSPRPACPACGGNLIEIRAKAEGAAARVYAQSYAKDPDFYRFLRRLEAYETMLDKDSVMVVQSDGALFGALQAELK